MKMKTQYRLRNWSAYNAALIARGSLTLWVDEEAGKAWCYTGPTHRGAQYVYADAAIKCVLTLRAVSHLALRASEGGVSDDAALPDLLAQVPGEIYQVSADGTYDKRHCYDARAARGAKAVI